MEDRNSFICSQMFFMSQKTNSNKLSLKSKRNDTLKDSVTTTSVTKHSPPQDNLENQPDAVKSSRSNALNSMEMEKYLEKFKNTKPPRRETLKRKVKQSVLYFDKNNSSHVNRFSGKSEHSTSECHDVDFKDVPRSVSDPVLIKTASGKESKTVSGSWTPNNTNCVKASGDVKGIVGSSNETENKCVEKSSDRDSSVSADGTNILLCPLCWKSFESKSAQCMHMKACATKNKVSTKQLLDLLDLIQKQEDERKALGLPLLPCKIPKKVKKDSITSTMRPKNNFDGNIQLGIALSVSLKESEQLKERDHLLEAGLFDEVEEKGLLPTQEVQESQPLPTAPIFLNVGKKAANIGISIPKTRRKNPKCGLGGCVPTLLKRTSEDREKLITEKVAIILVGDENANPANCKSLDGKGNILEWEIQSEELKKYLFKENMWWKMASLSQSFSSEHYYVDSLSNFISPCKVAAGSKLKHLSQIPGRNNTPTKSSAAQLKESVDKRKMERSLLLSMDNNIPSKRKVIKKSLFDESSQLLEKNSLSQDWTKLIGNREMSDVTIYTQEDRKIPAHKLVFFVRCPAILQELVEEETSEGYSSHMLMWIETCYPAALEFLRYIYAGVFSETASLNKNIFEHLKALAERYEVKELLALLVKVSSSSEVHENHIYSGLCKMDGSDCLFDGNQSTLPINSEGSNLCKSEMEISINVKNNEVEIEQEDKIISASLSSAISDTGRSSPDIFQEFTTSSPASVEVLKDKAENTDISGNSQGPVEDSRESLDYLVSLMKKDNSLSQSTESDPQDPENGIALNNEKDATNQISINTHISESTLNTICGNVSEPNTPKTPFLNNEAEEWIVYSTPALKETNFAKCDNNLVDKEKLKVSNDVKRKLTSSEDSDPETPTHKKICISEMKGFEDKKINEDEVIDLTQSGSETEEMAEKSSLNGSHNPIIPQEHEPAALSPAKEEIDKCPNISSPCETYISNVWDDFDYIPDVHHVDFGEPIYDSQKNSIGKGIEDVAHTISSLDNSEKIDQNEINDKAASSPVATPTRDIESPHGMVLNDGEQFGKYFPSSINNVQVSPDKEIDITEKLLDLSLQRIDSSVYWRDENEPSEHAEKSNPSLPCQTPVRARLNVSSSKSETPGTPAYSKQANITPMADYSAMKTPILHKELDRYGIKHLKRNQAKLLLRHIYNELHPVVSTEAECSSKSSDAVDVREKEVSTEKINHSKENKTSNKKKITFEISSSSDEHSSSEESSDSSSGSAILEESIYEPQFESPIKSQSLSLKDTYIDIPTAMKNLIESDPAFHKKILLYEPIWLNDIKVALKANGAKFNVNQLMDYMDEQCITFRIAQGNRHQRRRKPSKKKTFSLSQPCNQIERCEKPISSSQPS